MSLLKSILIPVWVFTLLMSIIEPPIPTLQSRWNSMSQRERDNAPIEMKADIAGISVGEFKMLSAVCEAESDRNKNKESIENRTLIAIVILNRVDSKKFPNTITKVLKQRGQFAVVTSGAYKRVGRTKLSDRAVIEATRRKREEKVPNILYFNCRGFFKGHKKYKRVGDNYFSY